MMALSENALEIDAAFVFADLSDFTALTEAHGNVDAAQLAGRFAKIARSSLQPGTRMVKLIGDEVMLAAESATAAVETTIELRAALVQESLFPELRIGVHQGSERRC